MSEPARDERGRWRPGHSGNPRGRPRKGQALSEHLRAVLAEEVETADGCRKTRARLVAEALVAKAIEGNVPACRLIFERLEGRAPKCVHETQDQSQAQARETTANVADGELPEWVKNMRIDLEDLLPPGDLERLRREGVLQ